MPIINICLIGRWINSIKGLTHLFVFSRDKGMGLNLHHFSNSHKHRTKLAYIRVKNKLQKINMSKQNPFRHHHPRIWSIYLFIFSDD